MSVSRNLNSSGISRKNNVITDYPHIADLYPKPLPESLEQRLPTRDWQSNSNYTVYSIPPERFSQHTPPKQLHHYSVTESASKFSQITSPTAVIDREFSVRDSVFARISQRVDAQTEVEGLPKYRPSTVRAELTQPLIKSYTTSWGNYSRGHLEVAQLIKSRSTPSPYQAESGADALRVEDRNNAQVKPTATEDNLGTLPFPPCPECGHVQHSTRQSSWAGRGFASLKGLLTPEECQQIESLAGDLRRGTVGVNNTEKADDRIRRADISWIEASEASKWLYERIWAAIGTANENLFKYDIQWLEPLQYSVYRADDQGGYAPHYDWGNDARGIRKLSFSIQLTDERAYAGGDLVIWAGHPDPVIADRSQGSITVFPSWMLHSVTPVEQGVRKSLVGWFEGPVYF